MAATVSDFLEAQLGQDVVDRLGDAVQAHRNLRLAIDQTLRDGNVSAHAIDVLKLVGSLCSFTRDVPATCGWLLSQLNEPSSKDLAMLLFSRDRLDVTKLPTNSPDLKEIRVHFYEAEPLLAIMALLLDKQFSVSETIAQTAAHILAIMALENLEIGSPELAERVKRDLFDTENNRRAGPLSERQEGKAQEQAGQQRQLSPPPAAALRPAENQDLPRPTQHELGEAYELVKKVRILSRLAVDGQDVPRLYNKGYSTIRKTALANKAAFVKDVMEAGVTEENALMIHDCAERLDCWNEQLWIRLIEARRGDFVPIVPSSGQKPGQLVPGTKAPEENDPTLQKSGYNLTNIFRLEDVAYEEHCSATSLPAYFTSLMHLLNGKYVDIPVPNAEEATPGTASTTTHPSQAQSASKTKRVTLLDILSERRPDLKKLELTGVNAQTLIPYIHLVNEVLESYIRYQAGVAQSPEQPPAREVMIKAYNVVDEDEEEAGDENGAAEPTHRPGNTDLEVYQDIISKQMFPFTIFPYNQARDTISQYFATFTVQMSHLFRTFRAPERLLKGVPANADGRESNDLPTRLLRGADEVLDRQQAAEELGLLATDFAAITGETFFPQWFADLLEGLTGDKEVLGAVDTGRPWDAATLWGFKDKDAMLNMEKGLGLSYIKRGLMMKSGRPFQDILDLARTQCFGQDLVITNKSGSQKFENNIEDLRLKSNASSPPFKGLTEDICLQLQSFMRLQAKLKWTTRDLDAAIFCLRTKEMESSPTAHSKNNEREPSLYYISPYVVKGLASVVRLSQSCDVEPAALLPLWGPIDCFGDMSLLHRKFITRSLRETDLIFARPADGHYFTIKGESVKIKDHARGISIAIKWPVEHFGDLLTVTQLEDADLDIDTLSKLYRYVLICRILKISPKQCHRFFGLFFPGKDHADPLANPTATLQAIDKWKRLLGAGWTVESLLSVLGKPGQGTTGKNVPDKAGFHVVEAILDGAKDMRKSLPFLYSTSITPSAETVVDCSAHAFDPETARIVVAYVEGTQTFSQSVPLASKEELEMLLKIAETLPKISVIPEMSRSESGEDVFRAELILSGVLTTEEKSRLEGTDTTIEDASAALKTLVEKSLMAQTAIQSRFQRNRDKKSFVADNVLVNDWPAPAPTSAANSAGDRGTSDVKAGGGNKGTAEGKEEEEEGDPDERAAEAAKQKLIAMEMEIRKRRLSFIKMASPAIVQDLVETLIINTVKELLPDLDLSMISTLLSDVVQVKAHEGEGVESAMAALQQLCETGNDVAKNTGKETNMLDAYFTPSTTDVFTILYTGPARESATLSINGLEVRPIKKGTKIKSWEPFRMIGGQAYLLRGDFPVSHVQWSTLKSIPAPFSDKMLLPSAKATRATDVIGSIRRVAEVCRVMSLKVEELEYMVSSRGQRSGTATEGLADSSRSRIGALGVVDLNKPSFQDLVRLQRYRELRDNCTTNDDSVSGSTGLVNLFSWLSKRPAASIETLADKISAATGWAKTRVVEALKLKYPRHAGAENGQGNAIEIMRNVDECLLGLQDIMLFDQHLTRASGIATQLPLPTLFSLALPRRTLGVKADFVAAQDLQARLTGSRRAASNERLMENQRKTLVAYLLEQDYVRKDLRIHDADGLFDHFLMDVQMGPQLRTSRIKQAISVVQLFVQRCLLGMEKNVSKGLIERQVWDWMQQHTMWEAHVKMMLYPENWIDPALRDDKSQLFQQLEASLMQKDLSLNTFLQAVKSYVCALNEIASLDIVSYLHESRSESMDVYHFFGRTRTSPHTFYYRTVTLYDPFGEIFWRPWTKIEMDIPSVEADWEGTRLTDTGAYLLPVVVGGRLYLFMPQLLAKTVPNKAAAESVEGAKKLSELTSSTVSKAEPKRAWEITMAWTELVGDSWTPKRVAPGGLTIVRKEDKEVKPELPDVMTFRVDPSVDADGKMTLLVTYRRNESDQQEVVAGSFVFRYDQITAHQGPLEGSETTSTLPSNTRFQKLLGNKSGLLKRKQLTEAEKQDKRFKNKEFLWLPPKEPGKTANHPFLWLPSAAKLEETSNVSWTLSKEPKCVTALVFSVKKPNGLTSAYINLPKRTLSKMEWTEIGVTNDTTLVQLDHGFSHELMEAAGNHIDPMKSLYENLAGSDPYRMQDSFGTSSYSWYHELAKPSALYNWEIGLHAVLLAVDRFFATQQYEEALQVARLVFDPSVDMDVKMVKGEPTVSNANPGAARAQGRPLSCWKFPPFQDIAIQIAEKGEQGVDLNKEVQEINLAILERRSHGELVHAAARGRPQAYMKWIVMKYAEILVASGDIYFRKGTLESLPLATQRYIEASHVLGPEPPKVPALAKKKGQAKAVTFEDVSKDVTKWEYMARYELGLPFAADLESKGSAEKQQLNRGKGNGACLLITPYFGVPLNPKFKQLRSLLHTRLFNIRNSLDIQGRPVTYALVDPPIDPADLLSLGKQGMSMSDALSMVMMGDRDSPLPRHRFDVLLHRALELCVEVRAFGERLLSAIEKKDAETFNKLRARQSTTVFQMMMDIKQAHIDEATKTIDSLRASRDAQVSQLGFYLALIGEPQTRIPSVDDEWTDIMQDVEEPTKDDLRMTSNESLEMNLATAAGALNVVASGIDGLVAPMCAIPQIDTYAAPFGVGVAVSAGGSQISSAVAAGSAAIKTVAMVMSEAGARAGRKAQLTRQLQDRRLQVNVHGREIKAIDKQIEIQKIRVQAAVREMDIHKAELEDAVQMENWYRTKYTNEQLYNWFEKSLRSLHLQAYTLAMETARRAESALTFEHGRKFSVLRSGGYWDAARDGLLAADHLYLDLRRLEAAYLEGRPHDFEISKTVSLRQINPLALLALREAGSTTFELGERLFDMDFPGHYMRRIRSVALSIPAVLGPYSNVNATLSLTEHKYRVSASASTAADYQAPDSSAFRTDRLPISSVAISTGSHDTGVFDLSFAGSGQYAPFEGAGAISKWRLEFPSEMPKFDYNTISDVLLHIQYTARDGGACLRIAANEAVREAAKAAEKKGQEEGFWAMWDLKNDFFNGWWTFTSRLLRPKKTKTTGGESTPGAAEKDKEETEKHQKQKDDEVTLPLGDLKNRLPFWSRQQKTLEVRKIVFVSKSQALVNGLSVSIKDEKMAAGVGEQARKTAEGSTDIRDCAVRELDLEGQDVRQLDEWALSVPESVMAPEAKTVENVYMVMHYVFAK